MLLRRFYISENTSGASCGPSLLPSSTLADRRSPSLRRAAPNPKRKNNRVLKTDIPEVAPSRSPSLASRSSTPNLAPPPSAPAPLAPAIPTI